MLTPHPLREALHNEVHARPPERLAAPLALSHLAVLTSNGESQAVREHLDTLLRARHLPLPAPDASHVSLELGGGLHLRWERHTEFHAFTFWRAEREAPGFDAMPASLLPQDWLARTPGQWLVGLHLAVLPQGVLHVGDIHANPLVRDALDDDSLVASSVMDAQGEVATDFRLHADGYARYVMRVGQMSQRRLGRAVQRIVEIETYRMMALLGLPAARAVGQTLADAEVELANVAGAIRDARKDQEPELLRQLTALAGRVESLYAATHARFSASTAYFELVQRRIDELRETPLPGLQTIREFVDRRLAPAMQTCLWAQRRQQALSERISRTSNLLRTRVEIAQAQGSQALLVAMNRRQKVQLLLQSAVEGLSVAAITYYGAGLVGYLAKGGEKLGLRVAPEVVVAVAIPLIAIATWLVIRKLHRAAHAAVES